MKYVTADLHLGHTNIIKYCDRPFIDVDEMNRTIVNNWNKVVKKGDDVYILGDICMELTDEIKKLLDMLNGNLFLINGNHDKFKNKHLDWLNKRFVWRKDYYLLKYNKKKIILCHYPLVSWDSRFHGSYMLFGHCHGVYEAEGKSTDVGVDTKIGNFVPCLLDDVIFYLDEKTNI